MADWREELVEQLRQGKKIQAISSYREATGASLLEAKNFIEELERSLELTPPGPEPIPELPADQQEIAELIRSGQMLAAIKRYKERHGVGLREAKLAVDRIAREAGLTPARTGCALIFVCGLAGLLFAGSAAGAELCRRLF